MYLFWLRKKFIIFYHGLPLTKFCSYTTLPAREQKRYNPSVGMALAAIRPTSRVMGNRMAASAIPTGVLCNGRVCDGCTRYRQASRARMFSLYPRRQKFLHAD